VVVDVLPTVYTPLLLPDSVLLQPVRVSRQERQSRCVRKAECIPKRLQGYAVAQEGGFS
jgi:hypothetical protein